MGYTKPQTNVITYSPIDGSYREAVLEALDATELNGNVVSATNGSFVVNNTAEKTVTHFAIVALEDTIFTSIKVGGTDSKASYIADASVAIKAGAILRPTSGSFSGVQLTSGSVALIL